MATQSIAVSGAVSGTLDVQLATNVPEFIEQGELSGSARMAVIGDAMSPTICDGDIVELDCQENTIGSDGVYFLSWKGHYGIYRVQLLPGKRLRISHDNEAYIPVEVERNDPVIEILGRVTRAWNARRF